MDYQPMMRDSSADRTSTAAASATDRRGVTTTLSVYWCGTDGVLAPATTQIGLFFLLMYLYPVARITRGLVQEKELRLRELCLMMGTSKVFNTNVGTFF